MNLIEEIGTELEKNSFQVAQNVVSAIYKRPQQLITQPLSGALEPYLSELELGHRFLLVYNYKIIYRLIDKHTVYITDVFPTKRNPSKIKVRAEESDLL